jgi:dethiobiotin synthetase
MALRFLLAGTAPRSGKTTVGCALAYAFKVRELRVAVMKPVQTGCPEYNGALVPEDAVALRSSASSDHPLELICPYRYRCPLAPALAAEIDGVPGPDFAELERAYQRIAAGSDVTIVEDAVGLAAPIDWSHDYAGLALSLGLELVLVVPNDPGFINAARLSVEYAARRGVAVRGLILNSANQTASETVQRNAGFLSRATGAPCLGTVRYKEPLAQKIVERLL